MTRFYLTITAVCLMLPLAAQQGTIVPANIRAINTLERLTYANGGNGNEMIYGVALPEGKVIGDTYLATNWRRSAILLYAAEKLLEGFSVRYDIRSDELDVKTDKGIKVLSGRDIRSFTWIDSLKAKPSFFINAKEFKNDGVPLTGFLEVLSDGKTPLFKKMNISVKKADYNVALSVGSRDDKILKHPGYYMLSGNQNEVVAIPATKKKLLLLFQAKSEEMEKYISANDLSVKKEDDLVKIFSYYNTILAPNP